MTRILRWLSVAGAGLLAGAVGTILMFLLLAAGRRWLGISPPPESIPDRFAPTLDIDTFFSLFGRFGGYNGLKRFGVTSISAGMAVVGLLLGLAYALVVERRRNRGARPGRWGLSRAGLWFGFGAVIVLWVASLVVLWPVLGANYRGLPPTFARPVSALGLLIPYAAYGLALIATYHAVVPPAVPPAAPGPVGRPVGRRVVLAGAAGAALALPTGSLVRRLEARATFSYDGLTYSGPGVEPIAPNDKFYTVTKNVVDPNPSRDLWRLEVGGLVETPLRLSFDDLSALTPVEQESTLMCISNRIGSGLFSNTVWSGVPMRDLLAAAGAREDAVEVKLSGADGFTDTFAFEKAMDPTTIVAYAMNGEPLPQRHGYPARIVVPGLYGEKNVKWVTRIEVVDYDAKGFYEQQGWGPNFVIPTRSDIFAPQWRRGGGRDAFSEPFPAGEVATIRGRAFAGDRGVAKVEFSDDDGANWQEVEFDYPGTSLTWSFWRAEWRPTAPGEYLLVSRATDGTGELQTSEVRGIVPQGATGYHRVYAQVEAT